MTIFWCDRYGVNANCAGNHTNSASAQIVTFIGIQSPIADALDTHFSTFEFRAPLTNASVSNFWFEVTDSTVPGTVVQNNGGGGYVIEQDTLIYSPDLSTTSQVGDTVNYNIVAGVRSYSLLSKLWLTSRQYRSRATLRRLVLN